ncbi:helix-turn-helix domain-containing protein [Kaistella montana]|uniref:Helix-turn-helix domain-containing protein n=1 Tax=Kaistella montana TaxID=1849733 RepID=A0ABW5KCH8_9FLAO|nr:helix-turn-helix domain-containing protein [Kaistella montana]MCQ4036119.1 helix-turn-helix domain-containing protein [Kaistella montana]
MKKYRDWGVSYLKDLEICDDTVSFPSFSILYTATDHTHILIFDNEIHIEPESFYFIPSNSPIQVIGKPKNAVIVWFTIDFFVDHLEFLKYLKTEIFSKNPLGIKIKNTFLEQRYIIRHYYLPTQKEGINKLFSRNILRNLLEFVLIRTLLELNPKMEGYRKDSYEKEVANDLVFILDEEATFKFNVEYYADKLNITKRTLDNAIKSIYGCTTKRFINAKAIQRAKKLLQGTDVPIKNISIDIGFSEESNFSNFFKKHTGTSPRKYREQSLLRNSDLKTTKITEPIK